jgi:signal transduction histidine kinase
VSLRASAGAPSKQAPPGEILAIDVQTPDLARRVNRSLLAINAALILTSVLAFYAVWRVGSLAEETIAHHAGERRQAQELRVIAQRSIAANRGFLLTGDAGMLLEMREADADFYQRARALEQLLASAESQQLLAAAVAVKRTHGEAVAAALEMRLDDEGFEELHDVFESQVLPATAQLGAILLEFVEHKTMQLNQAARNTSTATNVAWWSLLILALVNIVVSPLVTRLARRTVNALRAHAADLERAVRAREEFLAVAGHELRTPLSVLKLQIQTLKRRLNAGDPSALDAEALAAFTNQMDRGVTGLTLLLDRMLDGANIEQGQLALQREPVDLAELTGDVIEQLAPQITGANCCVDYRPSGPALGFWDRARLEQVVTNLLMNVIRHAPGKPASVSVRCEDGTAYLVVEDRGPGLAEQDRKRIFERFERAEIAPDGAGMGLGLTVTRQIVRAHGGRIWAEAGQCRGARFVVELPARQ